MSKVTKETSVMFGVGYNTPKYEITLRAGLRVKPIKGEPGGGPQMYWLDEFPTNEKPPYTSFPMDSFTRHDAIHYGIRLTEEQVQDA